MRQLAFSPPLLSRATYPILIGSKMLSALEAHLKSFFPRHGKVVIITDTIVRQLYGEALESALRQRGYTVLLLSFPAGEKQKTAQTKAFLEEGMLRHQCGRETLIVGLGGGVVGDVAGFVAATYLRGIPYLQIPTTLLAMVDSSVGGKTGINTAYGKNLIGALWQPQAVIADLYCLKTLPQQELIAGLIEAAKMFLTNDASSFHLLQQQLSSLLSGDLVSLEKLVAAALIIKIGVVQRDESEQDERMILNFGHTIGHALEQISDYSIPHAMAVGLGILVESKISQLLGILSARDFEAVSVFLRQLHVRPSLLQKNSFRELLAATKHDKKTRQDQPHYVLLERVGEVHRVGSKVAYPVNEEVVLEALTLVSDF